MGEREGDAIALREDALRDRCIEILFQLCELKAAAPQIPSHICDSKRGLPVDDVCMRIACAVGRVMASYSAERERALAERRETIALGLAEQAIEDIGRLPDVACVLAVGASLQSERVRQACRNIAALVGLWLAPDLLGVRSRREFGPVLS